jgi:very-short-patch-repair endonuclease
MPYERALWKLLRAHQLEGFGFRRQHPIGPYFADFACPAAKLVLELDGNSHDERQAHDSNRNLTLQEIGWTTLRFRNIELRDNPEGVWLQIKRVLVLRNGVDRTPLLSSTKRLPLLFAIPTRAAFNLTRTHDSPSLFQRRFGDWRCYRALFLRATYSHARSGR